MRKITLLILLFITTFLLIGCDYPEKDIKLLPLSQIPKEVTRNFELPNGVLGPITYTADRADVFIISNLYEVEIIQSEEDVVVTVEARVKKAFVNFEVKILKIGSSRTIREKFVDLDDLFRDYYDETLIDEPVLLLKEYDIFTFEHYLKLPNDKSIYLYEDGYDTYLVPNLVGQGYTNDLVIKVNVDGAYYNKYEKTFKVHYETNRLVPHEEIFKGLNIDLFGYNYGHARIKLNLREEIDFNNMTSSYSNNFTYEIKDQVSHYFNIKNNILTVNPAEAINWSGSFYITIYYEGFPMIFKISVDSF